MDNIRNGYDLRNMSDIKNRVGNSNKDMIQTRRREMSSGVLLISYCQLRATYDDWVR